LAGCDVGVFGLGVMGEAFALNLESRGLRVAVYNRTPERVDRFMHDRAGGRSIEGYRDVKGFVSSLKRPRIVVLFVKAGSPVDEAFASLVSAGLERGDIVADCGNSHYRDSDRRMAEMAMRGIRFLGVGVSGGAEGALRGPSMMFGGDFSAYVEAENLVGRAAASFEGSRCTSYFGEGGAGHFVKIVHNGIEYAILQGLAEAYDYLKRGLGMGALEAARVFEEWGRGELRSFLVEATAAVLRHRDPESGNPLVEMIVDEAEQKGTGIWAVEATHELGAAAPTICEAVQHRILSGARSLRDRVSAAREAALGGEELQPEIVGEALLGAVILSYVQGAALLEAGSRRYRLRVSEAFRVWRAGCIIRSRIVEEIYQSLSTGLQDPVAQILLERGDRLEALAASLASFVSSAARIGVPTPAASSALAYLLALRSARLPANVIQAVRDYFGAHGFRLYGREGYHHSDWGRGTG
jgi:6-phosphogluconate dehydrogenase